MERGIAWFGIAFFFFQRRTNAFSYIPGLKIVFLYETNTSFRCNIFKITKKESFFMPHVYEIVICIPTIRNSNKSKVLRPERSEGCDSLELEFFIFFSPRQIKRREYKYFSTELSSNETSTRGENIDIFMPWTLGQNCRVLLAILSLGMMLVTRLFINT